MAPRVGLEPTTTRLTAECSTIELSRNALAETIIHKTLAAVNSKSYLSNQENLLIYDFGLDDVAF